MKDKYDKIRELQEQRDRQERQARDQAAELEEILEASRRADAEERGLVSSSKLSGPGFAQAPKRVTNPEDAYSSNMAKARFASPEAFSRNRATPSAIPDGSVAGMVARVSNSIAASASGTSTTRDADEPRSEHTMTMTVKGLPPSRTEVTQVVRRRSPLPGKVRREPPPVVPANLAASTRADGPAIVIKEDPPALPAPSPASSLSEDTPIVVPQVQRVTFQRPKAQPGSHRMVTERPANYGSFKSMTTRTHDTAPFGPDTRRVVRGAYMKEADTVPGPAEREITAPGAEGTPPYGTATEHDTSPGMGDGIDPTSPGYIDPTSPGTIDTTSPGNLARYETSPGTLENTPRPDTFPGTKVERVTDDPTNADDQRYKRVREIDALIARFAADVEVKVGQGRDNTFLRKRSEIVREAQGGVDDFDDDYPEESTQPRHRNIEIRTENTEIIPRRLPPRKRK